MIPSPPDTPPDAPPASPSGRPPLSLSVRLVAGALVWLVLMLGIGGGVLGLAFRDTVEREFLHRLDAMLRGMIAAMETAPDGSVALVRPLGDPRFDQIYSGWYWQVSEPSGRQLRSRSLWDAALIPAGEDGAALHTRRAAGPRGEPLLLAERDLRFPGAAGLIHVTIAGDLREMGDTLRRFNLLLAAALSLLGAGLAVAVVIQVRFGLRPLRRLAGDLQAVRDGAASRLGGRYPREVAPLAAAMNGVLDKDAELIERARTHVGNLAHGLKTPLAVLAAETAAGLEGGGAEGGGPDRETLRRQVQTMRRLIEHHLGRASAVAGAGRRLGARVAVGAVAEDIAAVLARVFAERHLSIEVDAPPAVQFHGHREDLEEILGNLMENACKWAAARLRVTARQIGGDLLLTVEDDGPGLEAGQAAEAARRGRRLDEMAPGWGLGLSIVTDLAEVNGGSVDFSRSDWGGLRVCVRLPRP